MRVLLVKMSSMGDIIHSLPAVTDAARAIPDLQLDWVVEEGFAEIPRWHPAVNELFVIGLRRWRRQLRQGGVGAEWRAFYRQLRRQRYDYVIDAQGLLKSVAIGQLARGPLHGYDRRSIREPAASLFYRHRYPVSRQQHAITRIRQLFAQALGYPVPTDEPDYGIDRGLFQPPDAARDYLLFLHGTSWPSKRWPEPYWAELVKLATDAGYRVRVSFGDADEAARAHRLAAVSPRVEVLPPLNLKGLGDQLKGAAGVVGLDTGLAHMAGLLGTPQVVLFGPTIAGLSGTWGRYQTHLEPGFECVACLQRQCSYGKPSEVSPACFGDIRPARVWSAMLAQLAAAREGA